MRQHRRQTVAQTGPLTHHIEHKPQSRRLPARPVKTVNLKLTPSLSNTSERAARTEAPDLANWPPGPTKQTLQKKNKQTNKQTNKHTYIHTYIHTVYVCNFRCLNNHCMANRASGNGQPTLAQLSAGRSPHPHHFCIHNFCILTI